MARSAEGGRAASSAGHLVGLEKSEIAGDCEDAA
jgi:hypothetical protein